MNRSVTDSAAAQIQIPAFDQRGDFAVGNRALQHPKATIRMDIADPAWPKRFFRALDGARDFLRRLDLVDLDVDDPDAQANPPDSRP